ncbi:DNA uptake protein [Spiroplasma syrphidicola EA-1]|uniref:DNA uptake protein n=1 Tax=Spiroplasma syrphidicola EA-1 TaxID=1276229 RepID=R4UCW8_9MOLU|nr:ComEC/Rec2 family competence protein [Spiroplasma syrphidicola]AGM25729.1 DNA uptake protein [Spiroplasma syrphidicola EA-1]
MILKFAPPVSLNKNQELNFKIIYQGEGYYFIKAGTHRFYLSTQEVFHLDDNVCAYGNFTKIKSAVNIYEFSQPKWLEGQGITVQFNLTKIIGKNSSYGLRAIIQRYLLRDENNFDFIQLIFFGVKTKGVNELYEKFVQLGIIHLLVISGFHINLFFWIINTVCCKIFRFKYNFLISFLIVFFYLYLLNFNLASLRAGVFLFLLTLKNKRRWDKINKKIIWTVTLLFVLFLKPYAFLNSGFTFSFTISYVLIVVHSKLRHLGLFKKILIYNLIIFLVTWILTAYYNYTINFMSIFFTIILTPVIELTYLFSYMIIFIKPLHIIYQGLFFVLNNFSAVLLKINLVWHTGAFNFWLVWIYYGLLITTYLNSGYLQKLSMIGLLFFSTILIFLNWMASPRYSLTMLNVGNGQAIVINDKLNFKTVLFDVGVEIGKSKNLVRDYLKWQGINVINAVFISHNHLDHYNNLAQVKTNFYMGEVIDNETGGDYWKFGGLEFLVLHKTVGAENENANSLVILVTVNQYNVLLTGDLTKEEELKMLDLSLPQIDLLQVAHHGSKSSSDILFLKKIKPQICFISDGPHKKILAPQTLKNLDSVGCKYYETNGEQNLQVQFFNNFKAKVTNF